MIRVYASLEARSCIIGHSARCQACESLCVHSQQILLETSASFSRAEGNMTIACASRPKPTAHCGSKPCVRHSQHARVHHTSFPQHWPVIISTINDSPRGLFVFRNVLLTLLNSSGCSRAQRETIGRYDDLHVIKLPMTTYCSAGAGSMTRARRHDGSQCKPNRLGSLAHS